MNAWKYLSVCFLFISFSMLSQENKYETIDKQALAIPKSMEETSDLIAQYINQTFTNDNDKIRAIFIWIATNIRYDIHKTYTKQAYKGKSDIIQKTLHQRKSVCDGYATLFEELANKVGITSFIVDGYTKQNGLINQSGHVWCVANIESEWFLFDPTWGAGYILNSKQFIKAINNDYFRAKPEEMIKSHMPVDPLWQLSNYPLTHQEFYDGITHIDSSKRFFNFRDSIAIFEKQSKAERYTSSFRRIKDNEINNEVIKNQLKFLTIEIEYFHNHANIEQFNLAIDHYNKAVTLFNEFAIYRNKATKAKKSTAELRKILKQVKSRSILSKKQLIIHQPRKELALSIREAQIQINELELKCKEQEKILDTYL